MFGSGSHLLTIYIAIFYLHQVLQAVSYDDKYNIRYYYPKNALGTKMDYNFESMGIPKGKEMMKKYKYKSDGPFKRTALKRTEPAPEKTEAPPKKEPEKPTPPKVPPLKTNETEAEKAERIHRTFEKLLTFVEIVGQVDNYVSTKWKNIVKTVSNLYEEEDEDIRLGQKLSRACPLLGA